MYFKVISIISLVLVLCAISLGQEFHKESDCKDYEVYESCGSACPETCESVMKGTSGQMACSLQCVAGCFCRPGMVRGSGNVCVAPEACRKQLQKDGDGNGAAQMPFSLLFASIALFFAFIRFL